MLPMVDMYQVYQSIVQSRIYIKTAMTAGTASIRPVRTTLPPLTGTGVGAVAGGVPAAGGGTTAGGWLTG